MDPEKTNLTTMLNELKDAIGKGDKDEMKKIIDRLHQNLARNKQLLSEQYASGSQCATQTDLILAACRNKQADTLNYLLKEPDILDHLPGASFDDPNEKKQRTEAFKHALRLDAFPMIEMLYDYWCGDLHWIGHDIKKLETLGKLLEDARVVCDVKEQQLLRDIHSLITFNAFQQKLYSTLCRENNSEAKNLVKVLSIYDEYSDLKNVRIPQVDKKDERDVKAYLEDKSSDYMKILAYIKYEVYFRKLDFNVALLILENLYIITQHLKQRFKIPKETNLGANQSAVQPSIYNVISLYRKIEFALFHFIYRTSEDWRLYLPSSRQITKENHTGIHEGSKINLTITLDKHKLKHGQVLFLERKSFSKSLNELKKILKEHVINEDPAQEGQASRQKQKSALDDNYLSANMYMSVYYSLSKIVYYIEALEDTKDINVLMIERVLQVTGEMLKSTPVSHHVLESTRALLQKAISVETIKYLGHIRNFLSKTDNGKLSTRIKIAVEQAHIRVFDDIKGDLKNIKEIIIAVLDIYKPILNKSLLEEGLSLLEERVKNLPNNASRHFDEIYRRYELHKEELFLESELPYQELRAYCKEDLTNNLLMEIIWICYNKKDILLKIKSADTICEQARTSFNKKTKDKNSFVGIEKLRAIYKPDSCVQEPSEIRKKLISCLISRVNLLKKTLQYPQYIPLEDIEPSDQLLRRYKHDQEFRFVLEMILADIANVLVECKLKKLMNKPAKLLREINLGNVLDHGDPFLEVIGDVFDSYDLSTSLLSKAIMFAIDGESIEALYELIKDNVDYETIEKENLEKMNDGQKQLYKQFQRSRNWKSYVKLVPNAPAWKSRNYSK